MVPKKFAHNPSHDQQKETSQLNGDPGPDWHRGRGRATPWKWQQSLSICWRWLQYLSNCYIKRTANYKERENSRGSQDLKRRNRWRIIFVCFSVFWTCNNVISILCTLLHKRMNPIPVKRSIVGLFYEWIVGLFYEWVVNLSLSVFEWGLVSTDSNEVTWMYFTVIIHFLYYKWKNEWIRLNLFSKNVRTWYNCIDVWYLFKHV